MLIVRRRQSGLSLIEVLITIMWRYAVSRPELIEGEPELPPSRESGRTAAVLAAYGIAVLVAIVIFPKFTAVAYLFLALRAFVRDTAVTRPG